MYPSIYCVLNL